MCALQGRGNWESKLTLAAAGLRRTAGARCTRPVLAELCGLGCSGVSAQTHARPQPPVFSAPSAVVNFYLPPKKKIFFSVVIQNSEFEGIVNFAGFYSLLRYHTWTYFKRRVRHQPNARRNGIQTRDYSSPKPGPTNTWGGTPSAASLYANAFRHPLHWYKCNWKLVFPYSLCDHIPQNRGTEDPEISKQHTHSDERERWGEGWQRGSKVCYGFTRAVHPTVGASQNTCDHGCRFQTLQVASCIFARIFPGKIWLIHTRRAFFKCVTWLDDTL